MDYTYTITNNEVTITGYTGSGGDILIPSTISGYNVKYIADSAFWNNSNIVTIEMPNTINTIGIDSFANCSALTSITFPEHLTSIGNFALEDCSNLICVIFNGNSATLGTNIFNNDTNLNTILTFIDSTGWGSDYEGISINKIPYYRPNSTNVGYSTKFGYYNTGTFPDGIGINGSDILGL